MKDHKLTVYKWDITTQNIWSPNRNGSDAAQFTIRLLNAVDIIAHIVPRECVRESVPHNIIIGVCILCDPLMQTLKTHVPIARAKSCDDHAKELITWPRALALLELVAFLVFCQEKYLGNREKEITDWLMQLTTLNLKNPLNMGTRKVRSMQGTVCRLPGGTA